MKEEIVLIAIVQGLSEFLPISSSGHIVLLQKLLAFEKNQFFYNIIAHLGTLLAVLFFFRQLIFQIIRDSFLELKKKKKKENLTQLAKILIACIPAGLIGFFLKTKITSLFQGENIFFLGVCFIAMGGFLLLSKKKPQTRSLSWLIVIIIGLIQVLALFPGISRSGITIVTGILMGIKPREAFTFSFLIGIPLFLAAAGLELFEIIQENNFQLFLSQKLINSLTICFISMLSGFWALTILYRFTLNQKLHWFSLYLLPLGIIIIIRQTLINF